MAISSRCDALWHLVRLLLCCGCSRRPPILPTTTGDSSNCPTCPGVPAALYTRPSLSSPIRPGDRRPFLSSQISVNRARSKRTTGLIISPNLTLSN
ncbi:hypothetical protein Ae201684_015385 [Aphanomyces euteiches]|uniref:Secreted protein n=1 Tax=Aphanomyces euteiches TaxID=100861 RepID=A0A6G0WGV4_9STRA|nr:hypothetical protein Ae201684_015385 [Aphanomyces euteiches]